VMSSPVPLPTRVVERYEDGEDATHYTFELQDKTGMRGVEPGQFFMLTVPGHGEAAFTYVKPVDTSGRFQALVRRVGSLTSALAKSAGASVLGVRGPFGRGWPHGALVAERVLVIAGGCGLAPLAPALDALCQQQESKRAVLIYGSRTPAQQVLARERADWNAHLPLLEIFDHPTHPGDLKGTPLDFLSMALDELAALPDFALICGPETMMQRTAHALLEYGLAKERVFLSIERRMHCAVGLCGHCYVANHYACKQGPTYRYDELMELYAKSPPRESWVTEVRHC